MTDLPGVKSAPGTPVQTTAPVKVTSPVEVQPAPGGSKARTGYTYITQYIEDPNIALLPQAAQDYIHENGVDAFNELIDGTFFFSEFPNSTAQIEAWTALDIKFAKWKELGLVPEDAIIEIAVGGGYSEDQMFWGGGYFDPAYPLLGYKIDWTTPQAVAEANVAYMLSQQQQQAAQSQNIGDASVEGSIAWYQAHGIPLTPGGVLTQEQVSNYQAIAQTPTGQQAIASLQSEAPNVVPMVDVYGAELTRDLLLSRNFTPESIESAIAEAQAFLDTVVRLDSGEYVDKAQFDAIEEASPELAEILKSEGIDKYSEAVAGLQTSQAEVQTEFQEENVELGDGTYISKQDFDSLTPQMQELVLSDGLYAVSLEGLSPQEKFNKYKEWGLVTDNDYYHSIDPETGEPTYISLTTTEQSTLNKLDSEFGDSVEMANERRRAIVLAYQSGTIPDEVYSGLPGKGTLTRLSRDVPVAQAINKYWDSLSKDTKALVVAGYETRPKGLQVVKESALTLASFVPVVSFGVTAYQWNKMENWQKGLSLAGDILMVAPLLNAAAKTLRGIISPSSKFKAAINELNKIETARYVETSSVIEREFGRIARDNYMGVLNAQKDYINTLAKPKASPQLVVAKAQALENAAREYVASMRQSQWYQSIGFDSPMVSKSFNEIPREIVRRANSAYQSIKNPSGVNIRALEGKAAQTKAALNTARARWPNDGTKWIDLAYENMIAESELAQARAGSISAMQTQLYKVADEISKTEKAIKTAGNVYTRDELIAKLDNLRAKQATMKAQIDANVRSMEVEWGRGGELRRGATTIETRPIETMPMTGTGSPKTYTVPVKPLTMAVAGTLKALAIPSITLNPTIKPSEMPDISTITAPDVLSDAMTQLAAKTAQSQVLQLRQQGLTDQAIQERVQPITEVALVNAVSTVTNIELRQQAETEIKPITEAAIKIALRTATKTDASRMKPPPIAPPEEEEEQPEEELAKYKGAITWQQGKIRQGTQLKTVWHVIKKPYTQEDYEPYVSDTPPPGAIVTSASKAAQTIQNLGGEPPAYLDIDMGIQDVRIRSKGQMGETPTMQFVYDKDQNTSGDVVIQKSRKYAREKRAKQQKKVESSFIIW